MLSCWSQIVAVQMILVLIFQLLQILENVHDTKKLEGKNIGLGVKTPREEGWFWHIPAVWTWARDHVPCLVSSSVKCPDHHMKLIGLQALNWINAWSWLSRNFGCGEHSTEVAFIIKFTFLIWEAQRLNQQGWDLTEVTQLVPGLCLPMKNYHLGTQWLPHVLKFWSK